MNREILEEYKNHPRVLEIRLVLLFNLFENEYGYVNALSKFDALGNAFQCNMNFIHAILNKSSGSFKKMSKSNYIKWRQEVIFTNYLWGLSSAKVCKLYLGIDPHTLYSQTNYYKIDKFCTPQWLDSLDGEVLFCGEPSYKLEVDRFFKALDELSNVIEKWKGWWD